MTYYRLTAETRLWRDAILSDEEIFPAGTIIVDDPESGLYHVMERPRFARRTLPRLSRVISPLEALALEAL